MPDAHAAAYCDSDDDETQLCSYIYRGKNVKLIKSKDGYQILFDGKRIIPNWDILFKSDDNNRQPKVVTNQHLLLAVCLAQQKAAKILNPDKVEK